MQEKQQAQAPQKTTAKEQAISRERRLLGFMLIIAAITTLIFVAHVVIESSMSYEAGKVPSLSYFTIQSNIIIAVWFVLLAIYMINGNQKLKWTTSRSLCAALTTYIMVTGIIYWAVLVPIFSGDDGAWLYSSSNIWLHTTTPIITLLMRSYAKSLNDKKVKVDFIFFYIYPALYIVMAMIYASKGTYLYPMFNPDMMGSWIGVAICLAAMLIVFTGMYILLLGRRKTKKEVE